MYHKYYNNKSFIKNTIFLKLLTYINGCKSKKKNEEKGSIHVLKNDTIEFYI